MERGSKEPVIENTYMASKASATINLLLGVFAMALELYLMPSKQYWYQYLGGLGIFLIGITLIQFACNEFRKAAALDRVIKMSNKS